MNDKELKNNEGLLLDIIKAWEALPEGNHRPEKIASWLLQDMKPVIDRCREYTRTNPSSPIEIPAGFYHYKGIEKAVFDWGMNNGYTFVDSEINDLVSVLNPSEAVDEALSIAIMALEVIDRNGISDDIAPTALKKIKALQATPSSGVSDDVQLSNPVYKVTYDEVKGMQTEILSCDGCRAMYEDNTLSNLKDALEDARIQFSIVIQRCENLENEGWKSVAEWMKTHAERIF